MTTGFTTRSRDVQEMVLAYFRSCGSEAEVSPKPGIPGAVDVVLRGALATRFETVAVPQQGQPSVRLLRLLFDREFAAIAPGYELIAPRSHVLRLIQNELAGRAGFTRSAAIFNLDGSFSDLRALGITLRHATPEVSCRYVPRRFYAVRYMLRQSAYERNEDTLLVVVDPTRGVVLPAAEAATFAEVNLVDLGRAPYRDDLSGLQPERRESLLRVFQLAEEAARERVAAVLRQRAVEMGAQLEQECDRVRRHFAAELREASPARRLELERFRDQEIRELQQRYKVRSELALLSLQEIVIPTVEYTLVIPGGDRPVRLPQPFVFDPLTNAVKTRHCDQCGQDRAWAYCARGNHFDCGACGTVEKCSHPACDQGACDTHAVRCDRCSALVCADHELACGYCESHRRYCAEHIIRSFEDRDICPRCARFCGDCGKAFPPQRSTVCVVCSRDFCDGHSRACPSCGKHHCQEHGATPRHRAEVYCRRCLASCASCSGETLYLKADLQYCAECGSALCRDHLNNCVSCGKALCASHTLAAGQGHGCAACFAACRTCQAVTHRSDLVRCRVCPSGDQGLHCRTHAHTCALCRQPMCDAHRVGLHDGRMACSACVGSCTGCKKYFPRGDLRACMACRSAFCPADSAPCDVCSKPFCNAHLHALADSRRACSGCSDACAACAGRFARDQLTECHECHKRFCGKDVLRSQFRDETYCERHAAGFVACGGCNRRGPSPQLEMCALCRMLYCPHCISGGKGNFCNYCKGLRPLQGTGDLAPWHQAVSAGSIPGLADAQRAEILNALMGKDLAFSFTTSESAGHLILRASWKSGFLNFFRRWGRTVTGFVVVREKRSSRVELRINL
jgi:hypothetical protein